jgi:hypothetical protein
MPLTDPKGGLPFPFGAVLPSSHVTTVWNQQPRAVDGGFPVGSVYPGDIEFSGTHTHDGVIVADTGAAIELEPGSNLFIGGTLNGLTTGGTLTVAGGLTLNDSSTLTIDGALNGAPTGGSIDLVNVTLGLDGIEVTDLNFKVAESTPTISQPKPAGTGNPGADGFPLRIVAQAGQDGNGNPAGAGADLVLGLGLPGSGTPDGGLGRLVKEWGDSSSYQWRIYEWCTGEIVFAPVAIYPLVVSISDGEVHACEVQVIARGGGGPTVVWDKINAVIRADAGTVTIANVSPIGAAPNFDIGDGTILTAFSFDGTNPNEWRVSIAGAGGDAIILAKWSVASLDGS